MKIQKTKDSTSGITLIALIITIIVLLILAGVTIAMLTGDSGILTNAENAKENTLAGNAKEQLALAVQEAIIEARASGSSKIDKNTLETALERITGEKLTLGETEEDEEKVWTVTIKGKEFTVKENGVIEEQPVNVAPETDNKNYIDCETCSGDGLIEKYKCNDHGENEVYSTANPGLNITYVCSNNSALEHTGDQRRSFSY